MRRTRIIQSLRFKKRDYPALADAMAQVYAMGGVVEHVEETPEKWVFRQHEPREFTKTSFRTWHLGKGVTALVALPSSHSTLSAVRGIEDESEWEVEVSENKPQQLKETRAVVVQVLKPGYVPRGFAVRSRIDDTMFTAECDPASFARAQKDPFVLSLSAGQRLRPITPKK